MSEPSPEQSFSIHLKSLTDFADEFTTQIQSLQAPMDHLTTMSGTPPQYGAFHEAWTLGAGEQAAIEEMSNLLGQVKNAIAFAGDVTGTVADGYQNADEGIAWGLGGPPANYHGGNQNQGPWSNNNQYGGQNQQYTDPTQNQNQNQNQNNQVFATPASNQHNPGPWVPNQNTSGPFSGGAIPAVGAVLGGAILGVTGRSKSNQPPANPSVTVTFDAGEPASSGALPLWTPPPDPGAGAMPPAAAPPPVFPGQDAGWTAASPQGGS
jgi:hypothetical protein